MNSDSNRNDKSTFAISKYRGWNGSYRRQLTNELGITLQRRSQKGDGNFLTMTKANAEIEVTNLQLNLRVFPFKDPLSFIGQSHFILGAGYEIGTANIKVQDDFVDIKEKANLGGGVVSANYYFPIRVGLWADIGALYSLHHYEFKEIGFESQPTQLSLNIGVSYGF